MTTEQQEYLCKCNNCGSILYDENPDPSNQKKVNLIDIEEEILPMELFMDEYGTFHGCGNCQTDAFLSDL